MKSNRRFFLKTMGLGAAGTMMLSPLGANWVKANSKRPDRNFIFCYFSGGWDHTLCLDPRDPSKFTESQIGKTRIQLGWDRLDETFSDGVNIEKDLIQPSGSNIFYGPAAAPIAKHFDQTCIVRGISMDTVTHEVGRRFFLTGMPPAGLNAVGSSLPTRIVAQQGDLAPIPNLVVRVESYNQGQPAYASGLKVSSVTDLLSTLLDGPQAPDKELRALLEAYRADAPNCDPVSLNSNGMLGLIRSAQRKSRLLVDSGLNRYFNFNDTRDAEMVTIKNRYNIRSLTSPQAQAAMAFQAIRHSVAQCVTIELASGLDSHGEEWASDHPQKLYDGFKALSQLVDDLKGTQHPDGGNLLDHTTILCFSEFTRTPMINNRDGRDHALVNSALMIGAGIPHNTVIGATSDTGMNPMMIDPNTGRPTDGGGILVSPRHISASLMKGAGYEWTRFRVPALPCLMKG